MRGCKAVQQSDQMYCDPCGLVWDMNDPDPPECRPPKVSDDVMNAVVNHTRHLPPTDHELLRRKEEACNKSEPCECHCACMQKILEILENKK